MRNLATASVRSIVQASVLVSAVVGVLVTCTIVALLFIGIMRPAPYASYPKRSVAPPVPLYPAARNIVKQQLVSGRIEAVMTFETSDTASGVYRFYDEQLPQQEANGWRPYDGGIYQAPRVYAAIGCDFSFFLMLEAIEVHTGLTNVTLRTAREGWCH